MRTLKDAAIQYRLAQDKVALLHPKLQLLSEEHAKLVKEHTEAVHHVKVALAELEAVAMQAGTEAV